jgi:hypothetical protein
MRNGLLGSSICAAAPAAVPEPMSLGMLGLCGMAMLVRRRAAN